VFYGGGQQKNGGYLATKTTYSGTGYVKLSKRCSQAYSFDSNRYHCPNADNTAIGLFARNTDAQQDFIAGAGGGSVEGTVYGDGYASIKCRAASGGGWQGEAALCAYFYPSSSLPYYASSSSPYYVDPHSHYNHIGYGGSVGEGYWFHSYTYKGSSYGWHASPGFHGGIGGGGASSISAFYNHYTKDYTSPITSATITGGGITGQGRLYVCQ
jgi:hypothetical protein